MQKKKREKVLKTIEAKKGIFHFMQRYAQTYKRTNERTNVCSKELPKQMTLCCKHFSLSFSLVSASVFSLILAFIYLSFCLFHSSLNNRFYLFLSLLLFSFFFWVSLYSFTFYSSFYIFVFLSFSFSFFLSRDFFL